MSSQSQHLFAVVYDELHRLAESHVRRGGRDLTLSATTVLGTHAAERRWSLEESAAVGNSLPVQQKNSISCRHRHRARPSPHALQRPGISARCDRDADDAPGGVRQVALGQKCVIIVRATGPTCLGPLEEGHDTKGYWMGGVQWGPTN